MIRKSNSDATINLILDVACNVFMEKGYNDTCVQDIIDHLGDLHKEEDSIYHYFRSKEDILIAITDRATAQANVMPLAV